jgi:uncharacterized protein DUF4232
MEVCPVNRMRLVSGVSATAAIAAAALAGCSSGGSGTTGVSGSSTPVSAASDPAGTTATSAGTGNRPASPGTGPGTTSNHQCQTSDLSLRVLQGAVNHDSTTGDFYVELTNTSAQTCRLSGFPGVELLGGTGTAPKPLGMKDNWTLKLAQTGGKKVQTLAPHSASAAYVTFSTRDPGASAAIPRAQEVQVIPPNQHQALTARIYNVETGGYVTPLVLDKTLNVGPMDVDGVPHK